MKVAQLLGYAAVLVGGFSATAAMADTINVDLGPSAEAFTLYGQGFSGEYSTDGTDTPLGSFTDSQGASTYDAMTDVSTFTLTGLITGGSAGYDAGTYTFTTQYSGVSDPQGGPGAPQEISQSGNPNQFEYAYLDPSTQITLTLNTASGVYLEPLVQDGNFVAGTNFGFAFTTAVCTGVDVCTQNDVGLTPGSTISGPVTTFASFSGPTIVPPVSAAPEPSSWALMILGLGGIGCAFRRVRREHGPRLQGAFVS